MKDSAGDNKPQIAAGHKKREGGVSRKRTASTKNQNLLMQASSSRCSLQCGATQAVTVSKTKEGLGLYASTQFENRSDVTK